MALPPLAALPDLKAWPGVVIPESAEPQAVALLGHVSAKVRDHAQLDWVNDTGDALADVPPIVATIVVTVAARVWANPEAKLSRGSGPFVSAWDPDQVGLVLTEDEKASITRAAGRGSGILGLGVISTTRGPIETATVRDDCWPWDCEW